MAQQQAYASAVSSEPGVPAPNTQNVDHAKLKREYMNYLDNKSEEIKEQQNSRRYYHGVQHTREQIKTLNKRKQPVVTYNRIGRKINAVVGLLERQRQDPQGYPRTPKQQDGADIATAVLRYVCDEQNWPAVSLIAGMNGSIDGLGGIELILEQGDVGDTEVGFAEVDPSSFFYDPRSLKADFSDARYMGVAKWADLDATIAMFPDKEEEIRASLGSGSELTSDPDSDKKWFYQTDTVQQLRLVDHWYMVGNDWWWCIYTGSTILACGQSYLQDEKKRSICKYIMYSANIDQDGDRYGFVRNMRSSQDEINQRRSKALHTLNSRRLITASNDGKDIELMRREAARPDGVITYPVGTTPPIFDDNAKNSELQGQLAFLNDAKDEIENYGFNPALIGQGVDQLSGRAMQMQQMAGIAELGPYLIAFKNWKLRVYRAIWCAVQQHWTGERWIRVTDDDDLAQFIGINQMGIDPNTGMPALINALGALDVDIIIDEGPDVINEQQEVYDTLTLMARSSMPIPPEAILEASSLPGKVKKRIMDVLEQKQQPNPAVVQGAQLEMAEKDSQIKLNLANAQKALAQAATAGGQQDQIIDPLEVERTAADIRNTQANTAKTMADAHATMESARLKPFELANEAARTAVQAQRNSAQQQRTAAKYE